MRMNMRLRLIAHRPVAITRMALGTIWSVPVVWPLMTHRSRLRLGLSRLRTELHVGEPE